jgi:uncharacterized protein YegP (UPF0339 family)
MVFEYWKSDVDGKWYWHLKAGNGEIVASSQGYTTSSACKATVESIRANAGSAEVRLADRI